MKREGSFDQSHAFLARYAGYGDPQWAGSVERRRNYNGSGPTAFGGVGEWPAVYLRFALPSGREDLQAALAERLDSLVEEFIRDYDLGKPVELPPAPGLQDFEQFVRREPTIVVPPDVEDTTGTPPPEEPVPDLSPPDYDLLGYDTRAKGHLPSMPRRYPQPDGTRRFANARLVTWKGTTFVSDISGEAPKHWHASIECGPNPVWDGNAWVKFLDDPAQDERYEHDYSFLDESSALAWIGKTLRDKFADCVPRWDLMSSRAGDPAPIPTSQEDR